ncbi:hypothetical protein J6590_015609 [Homalodisca vitripennis]|nr:hypothetical protein J6590_015609 [Homalodisca vitripennis]
MVPIDTAMLPYLTLPLLTCDILIRDVLKVGLRDGKIFKTLNDWKVNLKAQVSEGGGTKPDSIMRVPHNSNPLTTITSLRMFYKQF